MLYIFQDSPGLKLVSRKRKQPLPALLLLLVVVQNLQQHQLEEVLQLQEEHLLQGEHLLPEVHQQQEEHLLLEELLQQRQAHRLEVQSAIMLYLYNSTEFYIFVNSSNRE